MFWVCVSVVVVLFAFSLLIQPLNRKRTHEYEQIVVTPSCPGVDVASTQLNDENEDFSSRRRYHQSSYVQGRYVDDV